MSTYKATISNLSTSALIVVDSVLATTYHLHNFLLNDIMDELHVEMEARLQAEMDIQAQIDAYYYPDMPLVQKHKHHDRVLLSVIDDASC